MHLTDFRAEAIIVVAFVLCITIAPLLTFTRPLVLAKRRGTLAYGELASLYVSDFDTKWMRAPEAHEEQLVGSADIQSLADMGGSYELVRVMRSFPVTAELIVVFIIAALLPVAPLLLTIMPLSELIKKLAGILF